MVHVKNTILLSLNLIISSGTRGLIKITSASNQLNFNSAITSWVSLSSVLSRSSVKSGKFGMNGGTSSIFSNLLKCMHFKFLSDFKWSKVLRLSSRYSIFNDSNVSTFLRADKILSKFRCHLMRRNLLKKNPPFQISRLTIFFRNDWYLVNWNKLKMSVGLTNFKCVTLGQCSTKQSKTRLFTRKISIDSKLYPISCNIIRSSVTSIESESPYEKWENRLCSILVIVFIRVLVSPKFITSTKFRYEIMRKRQLSFTFSNVDSRSGLYFWLRKLNFRLHEIGHWKQLGSTLKQEQQFYYFHTAITVKRHEIFDPE